MSENYLVNESITDPTKDIEKLIPGVKINGLHSEDGVIYFDGHNQGVNGLAADTEFSSGITGLIKSHPEICEDIKRFFKNIPLVDLGAGSYPEIYRDIAKRFEASAYIAVEPNFFSNLESTIK